ncbi:meiosis protein SPO22/ZIP4 like-domain-containing protein [Durotheca rogersii]|uniref:meiosis protein SPO22/ZIP4 like-domain-containing protein n=1 Tax=Durotheca rogersii TaxID=419775 RepID=UPI0022201C7A|nr:meiosis protein SPO22/ZIP4 like-domain-containing protein [Durotheca rogersii]KAI5864321.1 meiosis protein SPO22/ZIP4 like-domain-containing protein [Durotheca rogersii]
MESNGSHAKDRKPDGDAKSKDNTPTASTTTTTTPPENPNKSPKKRRKVNHACVYCRRSERPCTRCIKRNIGHLCHDEPRDPDFKKSKSSRGSAGHDESEIQPELLQHSIDQSAAGMAPPPSFDGNGASQRAKPGYGAGALGQTNPLQLVSPNTVSGMQAGASGSNMSQFGGFSDAWLTAQNQFHDMHHYHPQYMLAPEVTHEFNLLNDFLNTSLLDDAGSLSEDQNLLFRNHQPQSNQSDMAGYVSRNNSSILAASAMQAGSMPPPSTEQASSSAAPADKTREFYLQAADPSGNDTPEARMQRVMKAKYDAGLLKPFNYIKGYARLSSYMDGHIAPASKQKILRQLDRFRPKFREKVQGLTDIELVYVEMWFERTLLEYDRVFAAMAVPACCWRRTGEIFRGNKEMAELIHVPVERLRDGKISLHEILTEESLVRYWEEFGTIAFDATHDTLLTACALKNPDDRSNHPIVNCCFSFMIRRDDHKIELENKIHAVKSYFLKSPGSYRHSQLDSAGTDLWNWCVQIHRQSEGEASPTRTKLLVFSRVFSFLVLALAQRGDHNTPGDLLRLEKLAIKTSRSLNGELQFALLTLQKAAEYSGLLRNLQATLPKEESDVCTRLEAEYFTLRIALAWKEDRLDVADHLYGKVNDLKRAIDPVSAENLVDSLFEIGRDLATKKDFSLATKWLERAYESVDSQALEQLSREAAELRLAVSQALVRTYLNTNTPEGFEKAENHICHLESEIGNKPVVLLLRLELLLSSPSESFDSEAYAGVLRRMVKSFDISESYFNLVLHHVRKLDGKSPSVACSVLDEFTTLRVLPSQHYTWVERVAVLRTQMATRRRDTHESIQGLAAMFDCLEANLETPLAAPAVLAVQTVEPAQLIWKRVDTSFHEGQLDIAEGWCRVATHPALRNSGPANAAKIARKLLLCALQRNSLDNAAEVLQSMSESAKREPTTLYLTYKLALRSGDRDMALECLRLINEGSPKDLQYLYACCIDAQEAEDKACAIQAMRHLVEKYEYSSPGPVYLPALLRVIIRLEASLLNDQGRNDLNQHVLVDDICKIFEDVLYSALRKIINHIFSLERFDNEKLAKYLRCLLKATLASEPEFPLRIADDICRLVKQCAGEVEWFATTAFNHGVDLFGVNEDELSKQWIGHALTLAHYHQDGGDLERELQKRQVNLRWDS